MKITVLGSGTSHGIPVIGCSCPVCASGDSRDKRMRASVFIEGRGGEKALIDAGPEFRLQALCAGITHLDAIFLTHAHADHVHGLDDVRSLTRENPLPVYANEKTIDEMKERFSYVWHKTQKGGGKPKLAPHVIKRPVKLGGLRFRPAPVKHGVLDILGWEVLESAPAIGLRDGPAIGTPDLPGTNAPGGADNNKAEVPGIAAPGGPVNSFLYLTDTSAIPAPTLAQLSIMPFHGRLLHRTPRRSPVQKRIIIIGALRVKPHETHYCFEEAMNTALGLGADRIFLTHICHSHFHAEIEEICRNFARNHRDSTWRSGETEIAPAYDGLELEL